MTPNDHLVLIDVSGFVHRAFHALPPLIRPSDNHPTGTVFGLCKMFRSLRRTFSDMTHVAAVMDKSRKNWRHEIYPEYKRNRTALPDEMRAQFPLVRDAITAHSITMVDAEGYEADDLIATYADLASMDHAAVSIVSSDKDLHQLIGGSVAQWCPLKSRIIDDKAVREKFGVPASKFWDLQSLMGDSTDGIPGVPGVGVKTAAKLIMQFGSFDGVIDNLDKISSASIRSKLTQYEHMAHTSRQLTALKRDVPVPVTLNDLEVKLLDQTRLNAFYDLMEFEEMREVA